MKTKSLVLIGVLIIALAAMAAPVMAALTQDTTITGNPASTLGITLNKNSFEFTLPSNTTGSDNGASDATTTITTTSNMANGWTIKVKDTKNVAPLGHMVSYSGGTYGSNYLTHNLTVFTSTTTGGGSITNTYTTLAAPLYVSGTDEKVIETSAVTGAVNAITFGQVVMPADPSLNGATYQIPLTFTITAK